ncbi:MAG TPA: nucleoside-diphosphate sugar epimerase, partial [Clostridiales bacterium]|nr:nucleoside-diphosphate sugar epimerase [Clostridiales bacterium]
MGSRWEAVGKTLDNTMKTISVKTIYLVTGATGHLGHVIVRRLTEKGCKVRALVLPGDVNTSRIPPGTEIIAGDLLDKESLTRFFAVGSGIRAVVIHCAGIVSTCSSFSKPMYDVNVTGTRNIVDLCLATRAAKLVYVSSVHALPVLPRGQKIREIG